MCLLLPTDNRVKFSSFHVTVVPQIGIFDVILPTTVTYFGHFMSRSYHYSWILDAVIWKVWIGSSELNSDFIPSTTASYALTGGLKPFCSGTNVHRTFSNDLRDRSHGHGRSCHPNLPHHLVIDNEKGLTTFSSTPFCHICFRITKPSRIRCRVGCWRR